MLKIYLNQPALPGQTQQEVALTISSMQADWMYCMPDRLDLPQMQPAETACSALQEIPGDDFIRQAETDDQLDWIFRIPSEEIIIDHSLIG